VLNNLKTADRIIDTVKTDCVKVTMSAFDSHPKFSLKSNRQWISLSYIQDPSAQSILNEANCLIMSSEDVFVHCSGEWIHQERAAVSRLIHKSITQAINW
jgi:hypothetical protein